MRTLRGVFWFAWLSVACAGGPSGPERIETSGTAITRENISVVEFSLEGASIQYPESHVAFGLAIAEEIAGALRDRGHNAEAVPMGGAHSGHVVITGKVVRIDAGSRALRYWVGYGAGAAKVGVEGSVTKVDGGEAGTFRHERWSGFGVFGGNSVSLVQKCVRAVGRDIAEMIDTGNYTRTVAAD